VFYKFKKLNMVQKMQIIEKKSGRVVVLCFFLGSLLGDKRIKERVAKQVRLGRTQHRIFNKAAAESGGYMRRHFGGRFGHGNSAALKQLLNLKGGQYGSEIFAEWLTAQYPKQAEFLLPTKRNANMRLNKILRLVFRAKEVDTYLRRDPTVFPTVLDIRRHKCHHSPSSAEYELRFGYNTLYVSVVR
jgi:hypothetical protein